MRTIVVVGDPDDWPLDTPGAEVVRARDYLVDPAWTEARGVRVFNLSRSYRYQSVGYYVSLLATARKHRPIPTLMTVLDMKSRAVVRAVDDEIDELVQRSLADLRGDEFTLSVYFGRNLARRHARLAQRLFASFPAPLLRARFARAGHRWHLEALSPIPLRDVPAEHRDFLLEAAQGYFARRPRRRRGARRTRYDLAILHEPGEVLAPSNAGALARFRRAAERVGFDVQMIERTDAARLLEFDALLVRTTTRVDHYTFRMAQRAAAEGLAVIDDPQSILRCTNKIFQTEALRLAGVPLPRTAVVDAAGLDRIADEVGLPCVLKYPDGSFSQGVFKCDTEEELRAQALGILQESELLLAQEFLPSDFDWRIGVLAGEPLYACRYHMARGHWQIIGRTKKGGYSYGRTDAVPLEEVPASVLRAAVRAAAAMGDSLYGVDLKVRGRRTVVIEVNDNPNVDAGCEDRQLGTELYRRVVQTLMDRVVAAKHGEAR